MPRKRSQENAPSPAVAEKRARNDKRERILQAAVKVFARKGYFAAKVSEIAKKADVADGTIYLYFKNKEDILVNLFDGVMAEHIEKAQVYLSAAESAPAKLQAIAEHHLGMLGGNRDLATALLLEQLRTARIVVDLPPTDECPEGHFISPRALHTIPTGKLPDPRRADDPNVYAKPGLWVRPLRLLSVVLERYEIANS